MKKGIKADITENHLSTFEKGQNSESNNIPCNSVFFLSLRFRTRLDTYLEF